MRFWGLSAAVAAFFVASPAVAATVERDDVDSADAFFTAGPGEANRVTVREESGGFRFTDTGAVLSTRSCTSVNAHEVFCDGIAETLIVETGDADDSIDVSAAPIAFAVGGAGDDVIVAARGSGEGGNDALRGIGVPGQLRGGSGDDTITAGPAGDELAGGEGNDTLIGGAGSDVLHAETGRDRLDGGRGNDRYVVRTRKGISATIADSGRDRRDSISVTTCKGVRVTATRGVRERSGRYTWPGGLVRFSGLDGVLPCARRLTAP
jgi:Ca2+-binding RTX toxin-like protein